MLSTYFSEMMQDLVATILLGRGFSGFAYNASWRVCLGNILNLEKQTASWAFIQASSCSCSRAGASTIISYVLYCCWSTASLISVAITSNLYNHSYSVQDFNFKKFKLSILMCKNPVKMYSKDFFNRQSGLI